MPTTPLESFSNHLLHLSLLQLVTTRTPFSHSHTLPLHTLTHLTSAYLQLLATSAKEHAERAGRTDVSLWDLGEVIEEIGGGVEGLREEVESGGLGDGMMGEMEDEEAGEERKRIEELARVMGGRFRLWRIIGVMGSDDALGSQPQNLWIHIEPLIHPSPPYLTYLSQKVNWKRWHC